MTIILRKVKTVKAPLLFVVVHDGRRVDGFLSKSRALAFIKLNFPEEPLEYRGITKLPRWPKTGSPQLDLFGCGYSREGGDPLQSGAAGER